MEFLDSRYWFHSSQLHKKKNIILKQRKKKSWRFINKTIHTFMIVSNLSQISKILVSVKLINEQIRESL